MTISDSISKKPARDVRTLCYRCAMEMQNAGIVLNRMGGNRSGCDKCHKPGSNYEVG